jgi:hypothetical protein
MSKLQVFPSKIEEKENPKKQTLAMKTNSAGNHSTFLVPPPFGQYYAQLSSTCLLMSLLTGFSLFFFMHILLTFVCWLPCSELQNL